MISLIHRNKTNKQREKREKERERDKSRNRLLTIENKLMVTREEVGREIGVIGDADYRIHLH